METVLRAAAIFFFLLVLFRITGRRSLMQMTPFDFVLLLVVAEATQQGLLGNDFSVTNAFLAILMLVGLQLALTLLAERFNFFDRWANGLPMVLIEDGQVLDDRLKMNRLDEEDIMEQARQTQGLERMEQIKYAVLERNGQISVIPKQGG